MVTVLRLHRLSIDKCGGLITPHLQATGPDLDSGDSDIGVL